MTEENPPIRLGPEPLSLDDAMELLRLDNREIGAVVTFSGVVRATEGDHTIPALEYEHYPRMAERKMRELADEAHSRWPLHRAVLLHRTGRVPVGAPSVIVAVAAGHRAEAFEAARWLIDTLKERVPIWKMEG